MILFKSFIGIVVVALFTLLGYKKSSKYKSNKVLWAETDKINTAMINNQLMKKDSVLKVLSKFDSEVADQLSNRVKGEPFDADFCEQLKEDCSQMEAYALALGSGNSAEQMSLYTSFGGFIKEKLQKAKKEEEKYSALCVKTGFLIGLMVFILII